MSAVAAYLYALLAGMAILFQLALALGAPWGALTQGGRVRGALGPRGRVGAAVSGAVLALMGLAMLSATPFGPDWPRWMIWAALGFTAISATLNSITPSLAERRLWGPYTAIMLVLALVVAFDPRMPA